LLSYIKEVWQMKKEVREAFRIHFKWTVLEYATVCRTVIQACREFNVPRSTFYEWKKAYEKGGKAGLARKKPVVLNNPRKLAQYVIEKFPFRIHTIRTDRGHEFQAQFHWHVEDKGMRHVYIKPRSPQLNGKVERSHRTDQEEFYQLLTYTDDVDLNEKLAEWERFYNLDRPHGAFNGKTPYEALRSILE
jgi:transposase InsO family protein